MVSLEGRDFNVEYAHHRTHFGKERFEDYSAHFKSTNKTFDHDGAPLTLMQSYASYWNEGKRKRLISEQNSEEEHQEWSYSSESR